MRNVISVVNHKGGVGKTTSAVNIAACLGEAGQRVLLVDFDPQGSASLFLGVADKGTALLDALTKTTALPVRPEIAAGVDLVPAGPGLVEARQRFTGSLGVDLLARCLDRTPGEWDWIIIDCPPSMGVLTVAALRAGSRVLIPVEANYLAINGLHQLITFLDSLHNRIAGIEIAALIPCRAHPRRRIHTQILGELEQEFPDRVTPFIRENVSLAEAPGHGQPVIAAAPRSHGAEDYRAVIQWLLEHVQQSSTAKRG